jgi:hypothetical protein
VSRWARAASLLALVLAAAAVGSPALAQAPGSPTTPTLELVERPPWTRPVDDLAFVIATTADPATTSVQVEVFSSLDSVAQLERSATADVGVRLSRTPPTPVETLPPGPDGTRIVSLQIASDLVDVSTTQIVSPGVHPVVISLLGEGGEVLDQVRTPVVRLPEGDERWPAPDLAVLLDVAAPPSLQPDGSRSLPAAVLGRLAHVGALLAAHPDLDLTVAAVPDTVDALAATDDPAAALLLERLTGRDVLAAPYVRLPLQELVAHSLDGLVAPLVDRGTAVLADRLAIEPRRALWDTDAPVGGRGGQILEELGFSRVVVPSGPEGSGADDDRDEPDPLVDAGPVPVTGAGPVLGLVADRALSRELAGSLDPGADAAHVELARYLLRPADDDPGADDDGATVLVRPGLVPADSVLSGLLGLLDDPEAPVRVGGLDLVDARPDEVDDDAVPLRWEPPSDPDLGAVGRRVLASSGRLDTFEAMTGASPRADDLRLQLATAVGAATAVQAREEAVSAVEDALESAFDGVHLSGQTNLNLTSRQGTLPVTVENANPFPVDVVLRVRSERLSFPNGEGLRAEAVRLTFTVDPADILRVDVPVEARATGSVPVFVELWSPDDAVQLDAQQLNVRSTAISGAGLVISLGALAVLLAWWLRHSRATRRARASDGAVTEDTPDPMG